MILYCKDCAAERGWPLSMNPHVATCSCCREDRLCYRRMPTELGFPFDGRNLRAARQLKGLTRVQFAAELGVTWQDVVDWENAASVPNNEMLERFTFALGFLRDFFFQPYTGLKTKGNSLYFCEMTEDEIEAL